LRGEIKDSGDGGSDRKKQRKVTSKWKIGVGELPSTAVPRSRCGVRGGMGKEEKLKETKDNDESRKVTNG
jgi:hypothetical protein